MSSEQTTTTTTTTTPQVDEVAVDKANVQPTEEKAVEAPVANAKVVEETGEVDTTEPSVDKEQAKPAEGQEKPAEQQPQAEAVAEQQQDDSKLVAEGDNKVAEDEKVEENDKVASTVGAIDEKVVAKDGEVPVEPAANGESNGKHSSKEGEKTAEPTEETNGVCKRKVDNCVETADEEKTPKKAKVVDDGDQAPVEETAA